LLSREPATEAGLPDNQAPHPEHADDFESGRGGRHRRAGQEPGRRLGNSKDQENVHRIRGKSVLAERQEEPAKANPDRPPGDRDHQERGASE